MKWLTVILLGFFLAAEQGEFSHKTHAPLRLNCTSCHEGAESSDRAGFPKLAQCQTCHRDYAGQIPSQRIYQLPDFVFFSHAVHAKGKAPCGDCHGDVWRQQRIQLFRGVKMKDCVDCHKQRQATEGCTACHELGQ
ncbi:MAG: cytochrome c3 family protein [Bryobacteraceae bacterium]|nr:cytochrome c3 family protein [Bryobacteraceae bacterium]MDW8378950.1 cytochrome c3 family protein [Bryobacterales bacterium]